MTETILALAAHATDEEAKLWLYHLAYDVLHANVSEAVTSEFLALLPPSAVTLADLERAAGTLSSKVHRQRELTASEFRDVSRTMNADTFLNRHVPGSRDYLDGHELLEAMSEVPLDLRLCNNELRGKAPLIFVAPDEDLDSLDSPLDEFPNVVRDALGLSHIESGVPLLRVLIEASTLRRIGAGAPTCFDAIGHLPFSPADGSDGWGRTIHLGSFADRGTYDQDGCREAVAAPVEAAACRELRPIGPTSSSQAIDDERMKKLLERARSRVAS